MPGAPIESTTPQELGLDVGLLYYALESAPTTPVFMGATRGGSNFDPQTEWRNVEYDGKRSMTEQMDRKIMMNPQITATLIQGKLPILEAGSSSASGTAPIVDIITPAKATSLQPATAYLHNVWWITLLGTDAPVKWRRLSFPMALLQAYTLGSTDQEEQAFEITISARLAYSDAINPANFENAPYLWETADDTLSIP